MLIHYLKIAFRNMRKYKNQTLISVLGLAVGFTCFALATLWIRYEMTFDSFHKNAKQMYVVYRPDTNKEGGYSRSTPDALANYLKETFPEIESATALNPSSSGDKVTVDGVEFPVLTIGVDIKYMAHSGEGANTQKQTDAEEVRASFQQANSIFFDEVPCRKFNPDHDLDTEFIRDFKSMAEFQRDMPNEHLFTNLKLYTDDGYFKNGAVLFFGQQPEDFLDNAFVRCVAYNDRVVITNPGGLISSIPPEKFGTMSRTRNPLIFGLFERIRLVEYIGSGVMRMRESMKEEQLPAPDFGLEGMFNITLIRPVSVEPEIDETNEELPKLSEIQTKVFDLIRNIVHCKVHCKVPK